MIYSRGDVVLVRFPNSDLTTYKKRPALIVQDTGVVSDLGQAIAAAITTSQAVEDGPTRISVEKQTRHGRRMGLLSDSKIVLDNLSTIPFRAIEKKLGTCGLMSDVGGALKVTLGLS
jgi:mRNA interferase MazF